MSPTPSDPAHDEVAPESPRRDVPALAALAVGVLGVLVALLVPFAPVLADETTVTWPRAGGPAETTTAFFVPYEPQSVRVDVPCSAVRAAALRDTGTTVVSSHKPGVPTTGFVVTTADDQLRVLVGGHEVYAGEVADQGCGLRLEADASGTTLRVAGETRRLPDRHVQEVFAFGTDLDPGDARSLRVEATTSTWFESVPTASKVVLLAAYAALAVASLALLSVSDRRRHRAKARTSTWRSRLPGPVDLGFVAVLGWWCVLGPTTTDDGFAAMTIRQRLANGDVSNYYRWANSSESPFALYQLLFQPWATVSENPLWMRVPSVVAALLTWLLLSRMILPDVLPARARGWRVQALAAVSFLAWWMPFGLGIRPEPFAALGVTAALAFLLRGVTSGRLLPLGWGALAAGLSLAVSASAITGLAVVLVLAPRVLRLMRGDSRWVLAGRAAAGVCLASVGLVAMFVDQSWFGARRATGLHRYFGPDVPWFQEIQRYQYLLGFGLEGAVGRRAAVLATVALLACVALALARGFRWTPGMRMAYVPTIAFALALVLLVFTPSKWTHYFGTLSGVGAAAVVVSVVLLVTLAREHGDRASLLLGGFGTVASVLAAGLTFSGENTWFLHSQYGVPWSEGPVRPFDSLLLWLGVVGVLVVVARDRRGALLRMPAVLGTATLALSVVVLLVSFTVAPLRQSGSYSIGSQMLDTLGGESCGIVDKLVVTPDAKGGVLTLNDGEDAASPQDAPPAGQGDGFRRGTGYDESYAPPAEPGSGSARYLWGSLGDGQISTGTWLTDEFALPELEVGQELAVSVAGRTGDGNRLTLEFLGPNGPLGQRVLDDAYTDDDERPAYPTDNADEDEPQDTPNWRTLHVDRSTIPREADRVRLRAADTTTDAGGWLAFTGPRVRDVIPMREWLRDRPGPTYVDWSILWSAPCLTDRLPPVGNGLAEPPMTFLNPTPGLGFGGRAAFVPDIGGSFAGVDEVGSRRTIPTRLIGSVGRPQNADWGALEVADYSIALDAYDTTTRQRWQWGWEGPDSVLLTGIRD